jgi:hypothetical protein
MTTTASDIRDIVNAYLEDFDDKWTDVVRDRQYYTTADEFFTKRLTTGHPSEKMTFNLKTDQAENTTADSFFKEDSLNRTDLSRKGEVKWHFQKTHFLVDRREPAMMSGSKTRIFDYLEMLKSDMYDGFFDKNEDYVWTEPAGLNDGSTGDPLPWGIPSWVTTTGATAAVGLNGGDTANNSTGTVGGVVLTQVPNFKNWNGTFASMDNADFGRKMAQIIRKCNYKAPKPTASENVLDNSTFGMYSDETPFQDYEDALFGSNENVGADLAKWRSGGGGQEVGTHIFNGVTWRWVPALSESGAAQLSTSAVFLLNWSTWDVKSYGDLFMDTSEPLTINNQHNTVATWMDSGWQMCCKNRRGNGVLEAA